MPLSQALFWRFSFLEGVNAIKTEEKRRHSVWLDDATWSKVQYHYKLDGCTTQNDFIDKAILFYCGYLQSEYAGDFLPKILGETLEAILSMFGDRIGADTIPEHTEDGLQRFAKDFRQKVSGVLTLQIAAVKENGFVNKIVLRRAAVQLVVVLHLTPRRIVQPNGMAAFFLCFYGVHPLQKRKAPK